MKKYFFGLAVALGTSVSAVAQTTAPRNGVHDERTLPYAFANATLYVDAQTRIENATLLIRDGKVVAAGRDVNVPQGTVTTDLEGAFVYPGLVDIYTHYGLPEVKKPMRSYVRRPQMESEKKGAYHWNQAIQPETQAAELFSYDKKAAEAHRKLGFGAVLTLHHDGVARGTGAVVSLADGADTERILKPRAAAAFSFDKGSSTQDYPSSLMGSIALLRQAYLDAEWYARSQPREQNLSLAALAAQRQLPAVFETKDKLDLLRADRLGDAFGVQYIIKTKGDEYQRLEAVKASGAALIVPLAFPDAYDVEDPFDARLVSLADMKHWELAPTNAATLARAGVPFALTSADLKDAKQFFPNLRKAIQYGLSDTAALRALTQTPAQLLGMEAQLGSLRPGAWANFLVTSGPLFDEQTVIYDNWIQGERYELQPRRPNLAGTYDLRVGDTVLQLEITGQPEKPKAQVVVNDSTRFPAQLSVGESTLTLSYLADSARGDGPVRLSGWRQGQDLGGRGQTPDGQLVDWSARYAAAAPADTAKPKTAPALPTLGERLFPFEAYGWTTPPRAEAVLIRNATVWTCEAEGKRDSTDVLLRDGKIAQMGRNLSASGARVVDGTGRHLTPGIIDEHSHIAISRGVNEGSQAVTAEVRIGDVVNSEDINIYRQLAGGVTAAQLLHGSANPVGGQSALIKLRWGQLPEDMKIAGADGFIKFALGENVKQSNWGDLNRIRFPQSRMGVEQVYVDAFTRAREYEAEQKAYDGLGRRAKANAQAPRRDLELETLVEILNNRRFISCHSYVQSEINMLMHVADSFGFKVNTFTHILEGYKLADKMAAHGAGGSTFADWWAYKMEVQDAIPYNAALMHRAGVLTAINSDDAEMGRRLNHEAAKAIKYGGVSEEDALRMITLNPAKLLHLDEQMGSIRIGKDADVVLWDAPPLSIYAKPVMTFVDGVPLFDQAEDEKRRAAVEQERQRLIARMMGEKQRGQPTQAPQPRSQHIWHCEDVGELSEMAH